MGKQKTLSLGIYPDVSLKRARERREEARKLLANDVDPGEYREQHKVRQYERMAGSFGAIHHATIMGFQVAASPSP